MMTKQVQRLSQKMMLEQVSEIQFEDITAENVKRLIALLKKSDLSYLYIFIKTAQQYFRPLLHFWSKYKAQYKQHLMEYMNILYSKVKYSDVKDFLHQITQFIAFYEKVTKIKVTELSRQQIEPLMFQSDRKLKNYKIQMQKEYEERENKSLDIVQQNREKEEYCHHYTKYFGNNSKDVKVDVLKELYRREELNFSTKKQKEKISNKSNDKNKEIEERKRDNIEQIQPLATDCYGCMSFAYQGQDLTYTTSKQQVSFLGSLSLLKINDKQVIKAMIGYLNGRGGIILIGTQRVKHKVIPLVQLIAEFQKEQYLNRIQLFISSFSHNVSLSKHIEISFIPIARRLAEKASTGEKNWIKGGFIMRIIISAIEPEKTYYYQTIKEQKIQTIICSRHTDSGLFQLKNEQIYEFLKERYREYEPSKINNEYPLKYKGNRHPSVTYHYNACRNVQSGDIYHGDEQYYKTQAVVEVSINPLMTNRQIYKKITLLVCLPDLRDRIFKLFKDTDKIQIEIDKAFPGYDFRLSNNTFLIFHNCKFQKLKSSLNKEKTNYKSLNDKKQVLLISTQQNVKIESKTMNKLKEQIEVVLRNVTKEKKVIFQDVQEQNKQGKWVWYTYVKCESNVSAVFLYFFLNNRGTKSIFDRLPQSTQENKNRNKQFDVRRDEVNVAKKDNERNQNGNKKNANRDYENYDRQKQEYSNPKQNTPKKYKSYAENMGQKQEPSQPYYDFAKESFHQQPPQYNNVIPQPQTTQNSMIYQVSEPVSESQQVQWSENVEVPAQNVTLQPTLLHSWIDPQGNYNYYYTNGVHYMYQPNGTLIKMEFNPYLFAQYASQ